MLRHQQKKGARWNTDIATLSLPIASPTASTTTTYLLGGFYRRSFVEGVALACTTVPVSGSGTILATLKKRLGAGTPVTLSSALDLEALTANTVARFTLLSTLTQAQRELAPGEVLYIEIVSTAAIGTAMVGGIAQAELAVIE